VPGDSRSPPRARVDAQRAADRRHPVGDVVEAGSALDGRGIEAQDAHGDGGMGDGCLQRALEAFAIEHLRRRPVRDGAQVVDGALDLDVEPLEPLAVLSGRELLRGEGEPDPQRDETLLGAVVEVASDPPPLGVAGLEGTRPRVSGARPRARRSRPPRRSPSSPPPPARDSPPASRRSPWRRPAGGHARAAPMRDPPPVAVAPVRRRRARGTSSSPGRDSRAAARRRRARPRLHRATARGSAAAPAVRARSGGPWPRGARPATARRGSPAAAGRGWPR
jgi:hypothetical protein